MIKLWGLQSKVRGLWNPSKAASCQEPHRRMTEWEGVLQRGRAGVEQGRGPEEAGEGVEYNKGISRREAFASHMSDGVLIISLEREWAPQNRRGRRNGS